MYATAHANRHAALKTDVLAQKTAGGVEFKIVQLQNSKDDIKLSLHANPTTYSSAGIQRTDYLAYLGFERALCAFMTGQCYSRWIPDGFDLNAFGIAFANSFAEVEKAEKELEACGLFLDQPEGWGYFYGKPSGNDRRRILQDAYHSAGNGHVSPKTDILKQTEDEYFRFALSFIAGDSDKGWVFHYHPKHPPISPEFKAAFDFLHLKVFNQCPLFDFNECYWWFVEFEPNEHHVFDRKTSFVHQWFDAHAQRFSKGIELLLSTQALMRPFGMYFLPIPSTPPSAASARPGARPRPASVPAPHADSTREASISTRGAAGKYEYDVALSFAGTERELAEKLAAVVRQYGFVPFYDDDYPDRLWGKDLVVFFDEVYRLRSQYCVIFVSKDYCERMWTNHERRSAQARMLQEKGNEYILPVRVDDSELPGMAPTIGYLSLKEYDIEKIGELLVRKLKQGK